MSGDLVDAQAAALAVGVRPVTIRSWANRGKLERRGTDGKRRALYSLLDVRRVHAESSK